MTSQPERCYRWLFWALVLAGFLLDQGTKYLVFHQLYNDGEGDYLALVGGAGEGERIFGLQTAFVRLRDPATGQLGPLRPYVNTGALWGQGQNNNTMFLLISLAAAVAIAIWSCRQGATRDLGLVLALGLILAGTLGNLYDRIVFAGVRDFLQWSYLYLFPTFNIADSCLVCGAALLLWQALMSRPARQPGAGQQASRNGQVVSGESIPACLSNARATATSPVEQGATSPPDQSLFSSASARVS
jgi:lipoprotein signal peptidase